MALVNPAVTSVSAFFPCYNDEQSIGRMVDTAHEALERCGVAYDVTVVNDGSTDRSAEVLLEYERTRPWLRVVTHSPNRGYGGALRSGFASASKEWVFYTDGDAQYDPSELELLVKQASPDVDVVQGYKTIGGTKRGRNDARHRKVIGRLYHHTVRWLFGLRIRDVDCDFRLIRRSKLDRITLVNTSGVICLELVRKLQDEGARFAEVPVNHYERPHGRSQFFQPRRIALSLFDLGVLWLQIVVGTNLRRWLESA